MLERSDLFYWSAVKGRAWSEPNVKNRGLVQDDRCSMVCLESSGVKRIHCWVCNKESGKIVPAAGMRIHEKNVVRSPNMGPFLGNWNCQEMLKVEVCG